jgi:hypothetical protein
MNSLEKVVHADPGVRSRQTRTREAFGDTVDRIEQGAFERENPVGRRRRIGPMQKPPLVQVAAALATKGQITPDPEEIRRAQVRIITPASTLSDICNHIFQTAYIYRSIFPLRESWKGNYRPLGLVLMETSYYAKLP